MFPGLGFISKAGANGFCPRTVASHQVNKAVGHFLAIAAVDEFLLDAAQFRKLRKDASAAKRSEEIRSVPDGRIRGKA